MVGEQPIIKHVRQFAADVRKQGVQLRKVFLFGSYAKGEQRELSDIDVALVADDFTGVSFEDVKRFIDVSIKKPYILFEFHTFKTSDFEEGNPFINEIKRTGVSILGRMEQETRPNKEAKNSDKTPLSINRTVPQQPEKATPAFAWSGALKGQDEGLNSVAWQHKISETIAEDALRSTQK